MADTERWQYTGEWEHVLPDAVGAPTIVNGVVIEVPVGFFGSDEDAAALGYTRSQAAPTPRPEPEVQEVVLAPPPEPPVAPTEPEPHDALPPPAPTDDLEH